MGITYKDSGVDVSAGMALVEKIKKRVAKTFTADVLTGIGGFGGLYRPPLKEMKDPVLVSGCDGVGTKLKIAFAAGRHDTVGIDLVAMSVNDVLTCGARPLFFLDYLACGNLASLPAEKIIGGIAQGCELAGCALLGGETAEMPGFYPTGEYDLAGFCVGLVENDKIIDGKKIEAGDCLIGLKSSGLHSNGFSLVRHLLFEIHDYDLNKTAPWEDLSLGEALLTPTKIYAKPLLAILKKCDIKGLVHVTGGGLVDNLPRVMPPGLGVDIEKKSYEVPPLFDFLGELGQMSELERYRTFNMGIGMVLVADPQAVEKVIAAAGEAGEAAVQIGCVVPRESGEVSFV